jgi:hypothetical protein
MCPCPTQLRELTDAEIDALKIALSTVLTTTRNLSAVVDAVPADDELVRDQFHKLNATERAMAERLIDLLDRAINVKIELEGEGCSVVISGSVQPKSPLA